jgi:non-heme chloroperoxidase
MEETPMGQYIAVEPDVEVYVEDVGQGKPIVFIHGWPVSHKMFEYQFTQLPQHGYRVVGVDLRGYGKSSKPWNRYSYDRFADDLRIVLDTLDLKDVTLAGFSMGGAIAIRYMARHEGQRVAKLALLGAAAPIFTQRPDYPYGLTTADVDGIIEGVYTDRPLQLDNFGKIFFHQENSVSPPFANWFHSLGMEASAHATAKSAELLRDTDLRPDLATISVPTGIFHGVDDKICPYAFATVLKAGIANSQIIRFEQSGHGLFYDEREKFNQELMRFIG